MSVYQQQYDKLKEYYRKIAEEQGLNPEHVAPDMNINQTQANQQQLSGTTSSGLGWTIEQ